MSNTAAAILAALVVLFLILVWNTVTGALPGQVRLVINLIALVGSLIVGFVVFLSFNQ